MGKEIFLTIPWPPSVNKMYLTGASGVFMQKKAKEFKQSHSWNLIKQANQQEIKNLPITIPVQISTNAYPPDKRKRDLSNLFKMMDDLLQSSGILKDDFLIKKHTFEVHLFNIDTKNRGLEIKISPFTQNYGKI